MSQDHLHIKSNYNKAFLIGIILNVAYIIVEAFAGFFINSMALIADAGHNLSDVLGLILAWGAAYLASKSPTSERTYGMRKSTILAALFNSILLFIAVGAITVESIRKFLFPANVEGSVMMIVAGVGVIINGITAMLFFKGRNNDLNIKGTFLHMASDAAVSLGVVAAGFLISITGYLWIDPAMSIIIVVVISIGTWSLLKESFYLSMDAVPKGIKISEVKKYLESIEGVVEVHDLHIWGMSTTETALTGHLVIPDNIVEDHFLKKICKDLHDKFGIEHPTIQIEKSAQSSNCASENI